MTAKEWVAMTNCPGVNPLTQNIYWELFKPTRNWVSAAHDWKKSLNPRGIIEEDYQNMLPCSVLQKIELHLNLSCPVEIFIAR